MPDLSREIRKFPPSDPGSSPIHVGLVYPNTYPVAVASLGFQTVHRIAHSVPGVVTHRVVLDREDGRSYPSRTLEEGLDIKSLDALLVSCSFEPDYLHLVRILHAARIPPLRRDRGSLPLVIIGGIAVTANPEPLAPFADAIVIGDAEVILPDLLEDLISNYPLLRGDRFKLGREDLYEDWDSREGIYVPALWEDDSGEFDYRNGRRIKQAVAGDLDSHTSCTPIISPDGVYGAKNLVEISTGCTTRCRFCLLSFNSPAGRDRSAESILENARMFAPDEASVGLVSSRVSEHPEIVQVINELSSDGYEVSVSSLKVSSTTQELLEALHKAGAASITFAPEHGSARMREIIGKPYSYEEVRDRVRWAFESGIRRVKLYFMTGFKEETDEDLDATPEFVLSLADEISLDALPVGCRLAVSIAPFVPKARTPFQRRAMDDEQILKRKIKRMLGPLKGRSRIDSEFESPREAVLQGALSIGDRHLADHLLGISQIEGSLLSSWDTALQAHGDSPRESVLNSRPSGLELPWSFVKRPDLG